MYNIRINDIVWISNYPAHPVRFFKCRVVNEIVANDPMFGDTYVLLLEDGSKVHRAAINIYHTREEAQRCLIRKLNKLQPI